MDSRATSFRVDSRPFWSNGMSTCWNWRGTSCSILSARGWSVTPETGRGTATGRCSDRSARPLGWRRTGCWGSSIRSVPARRPVTPRSLVKESDSRASGKHCAIRSFSAARRSWHATTSSPSLRNCFAKFHAPSAGPSPNLSRTSPAATPSGATPWCGHTGPASTPCRYPAGIRHLTVFIYSLAEIRPPPGACERNATGWNHSGDQDPLVENWECFERIHDVELDFAPAGANPLVIWRGDASATRTDQALALIRALQRPTWAFVDFDPAGLLIAARLPGLAGIIAPAPRHLERDLKQGLRNATRGSYTWPPQPSTPTSGNRSASSGPCCAAAAGRCRRSGICATAETHPLLLNPPARRPLTLADDATDNPSPRARSARPGTGSLPRSDTPSL
jgi:hypothetical protein